MKKQLYYVAITITLILLVMELTYINTKTILYLVAELGLVDRIFAIIGALAFSLVTVLVMRTTDSRWMRILFPLFDAALVFGGFNVRFANVLFDNPIAFGLTVFYALFVFLIMYGLGKISYDREHVANRTDGVLAEQLAASKRIIDELTQQLAETNRIKDETMAKLAETNRIIDETTQKLNETNRIKDESTQKLSESKRIIDELTQKLVESNRIKDESTQKLSESKRIIDETTQKLVETNRIKDETMKKLDESKRIIDELRRNNAETQRMAEQFLRNHILYEAWMSKKKSEQNRNGYDAKIAELAEEVKAGKAISIEKYMQIMSP